MAQMTEFKLSVTRNYWHTA